VTHLGIRVTALVDGELDPAAAERALAHAAGCPECLAALDAERAVKRQVASLADVPVPPGLTARLLALGELGDPLPARSQPMPRGTRPPTLPAPGRGDRQPYDRRPPAVAYASRRPGVRSARRRTLRRTTTVAGGVLSSVGCALAAAFMLGGTQAPAGPAVRPPVGTFSQQHAATVNRLPLGDPAFGAVQATWPGSLATTGTVPAYLRRVPSP
jgi:anti-sigma factor RsiW